MLKRVKKKYKIKHPEDDDDESGKSDVSDEPKFGITLEDYIQIFAVLMHIDDVDKVVHLTDIAMLFSPVQTLL